MDIEKKNFAIVGDGGWGTAFAMVVASSGHRPVIWGHDPAYLTEMAATRNNRLFLPGIRIPESVGFEPELGAVLANADVVALAVPSKFLAQVLARGEGCLKPDAAVITLTKGFDAGTLERPSEMVRRVWKAEKVVALSGPSHAEEVAQSLPASLVAASDGLGIARTIQQLVTTPRFRVYASRDLVGVEVAGAIKNIIALAAGIVHGMKLGDNALSALATRGLAEMTRLGVALGGEAATFAGLAGMGDLITTCISPHGRNRRVGVELAQGKSLSEILAAMPGVPESVTTTATVMKLAKKHFIEMPITAEVAEILWNGKLPQNALNDLMTRARKDED